MARITVEDCLDNIENRFELVLACTKRARQIAVEGEDPMVPQKVHKPTVLALQEIAKGLIKPSILEEHKGTEITQEQQEIEIDALQPPAEQQP